MTRQLDLTEGAGTTPLLLPAVQMAREAARRVKVNAGLGLSAIGAHQFFSGMPVSRAEDREHLAEVLYTHWMRIQRHS
jgi:hypothetical protein